MRQDGTSCGVYSKSANAFPSREQRTPLLLYASISISVPNHVPLQYSQGLEECIFLLPSIMTQTANTNCGANIA